MYRPHVDQTVYNAINGLNEHIKILNELITVVDREEYHNHITEARHALSKALYHLRSTIVNKL